MAALLKKRALAEYSQVVQESPKPLKKLRLAKKVVTGGSAAAYVGLLEKCKSSNDALQILLRISDSMKFQEEELSDAVQKLSDHYLVETESAVRAKILCLYGDMITEASGDFQSIVDVILQLIKKETSHKVLAQGISALLKLGRLSDSTAFHQKLVFVAKQYLCDTSHLVKCRCLQYLFLGLGDREIAAVKQFRLLVLALQLVYVVRGSNVSALALTEHFLEQCDETAKFLCERGVSAEPFCSAALRELSALEEAKPGAVARRLLPLLLAAAPAPPPLPAAATRATRAVLQQPCADADHALKFTAGLVVGLPLDAEIRNLAHPNLLRVKVKYPDQQTQLLVPKRSDLRPLEPDTLPTETASAAGSSSGVCKAENGTSANSSSSEAPTDFRLLTTVLISHQVWTEACTVDVSLALDLSEREAGLFWSPGGSSGGGRRTPTGGGAGGGSAAATPADLLEPCVLDLCKPVKVYVSPKPVKRGL